MSKCVLKTFFSHTGLTELSDPINDLKYTVQDRNEMFCRSLRLRNIVVMYMHNCYGLNKTLVKA